MYNLPTIHRVRYNIYCNSLKEVERISNDPSAHKEFWNFADLTRDKLETERFGLVGYSERLRTEDIDTKFFQSRDKKGWYVQFSTRLIAEELHDSQFP